MVLPKLLVALSVVTAMLTVDAQRLRAAQIVLPLTAFGQATTANGDGTGFSVSEGADAVFSEYNVPAADGVGEQRGILEFSTAGLPTGATITAVTLNFSITLFKELPGPFPHRPEIVFFGYAADGVIDATDAAESGKVSLTFGNLAYEIIAQGSDAVALDPIDVQSLVATTPAALGIMLYNGRTNVAAGFATTGEGAPTLVLTFDAVPEPSLPTVVALVLLLRPRRGARP